MYVYISKRNGFSLYSIVSLPVFLTIAKNTDNIDVYPSIGGYVLHTDNKIITSPKED